MVVLIDEAARYLYADRHIVAKTADAVAGLVPRLRQWYGGLAGFPHVAFEDASLLILSDCLLDSWQIDRVEQDFLGSDRPLRGGGRYYYGVFESNPSSAVEPLGIYGNHQQRVGNIDLCLYGNRRYRSRNLVTLRASDVTQLFGLPAGTSVQDAQAILVSDILKRAGDVRADVPPARIAGLQALGLIDRDGEVSAPILSVSDDRRFNEMAQDFTPILTQILRDGRGQLDKHYRESPYFADGVTFAEFFIWWCHVFYTAVTDELIRRRIIVVPPSGTLTYLSFAI